jgi:hypothetical protein
MQWQQGQVALTMVPNAAVDLTIEVMEEVVVVMVDGHNQLPPTLHNNNFLSRVINVGNRGILLPTAHLLIYALLAVVLLLPMVALASAHVPHRRHVDMQPLPRKGDPVVRVPIVLPVVPEDLVPVPPLVMRWYVWLVQCSSSMP